MDAFADPGSLALDELKAVLVDLMGREGDASDMRRTLHAQIDALRRELVQRMREQGQEVISGAD